MQKYKKIIVIALIFIFIVQVLAPISLATGDVMINPNQEIEQNKEGSTPTQKATNSNTAGDTIVNIGLGILWLPFQYVMGLVTSLLESIAEGLTGEETVTPQNVIFNDVALVDINFFSSSTTTSSGKAVPQFVLTMRENVAGWYYGIRTIAIISLLAVLIYIAIRMVISTSGEEKGKYKEMFKDWLVSFALLFLLHYLMMVIIYGNNMLVEVFRTALSKDNTNRTTPSRIYEKNT